jgi:HSP20 family protein
MTPTFADEGMRRSLGLKTNEIDQMLRRALESGASERESTPTRSNLVETWGTYFLQIALPGIDTSKLEVEIVARQVRVRGRNHVAAIEGGTDVWREIPSGSFEEIFRMPAEVDGDGAEAHYSHGILTVQMPKVAYLKPKSLKVHVSD